MSVRYSIVASIMVVAAALFAGAALSETALSVSASGPSSSSPLLAPHVSPLTALRRAKFFRVAACSSIGQTCVNNSQCCTGTCQDHGSKGMVCAQGAAQCIQVNQTCQNNAQCCTGICANHGSKGMVCATQ